MIFGIIFPIGKWKHTLMTHKCTKLLVFESQKSSGKVQTPFNITACDFSSVGFIRGSLYYQPTQTMHYGNREIPQNSPYICILHQVWCPPKNGGSVHDFTSHQFTPFPLGPGPAGAVSVGAAGASASASAPPGSPGDLWDFHDHKKNSKKQVWVWTKGKKYGKVMFKNKKHPTPSTPFSQNKKWDCCHKAKNYRYVSNSLWHCSQKKRRKNKNNSHHPTALSLKKIHEGKHVNSPKKTHSYHTQSTSSIPGCTFLRRWCSITVPDIQGFEKTPWRFQLLCHPIWQAQKKNGLKKHTSHGGVKSCWYIYI